MKNLQTDEGLEVVGEETQTNETEPQSTEREGQPEKTSIQDDLVQSNPDVEVWKQKFSASSREAQRLYEENKKLKAQVGELANASKPNTPADEVLSKELPEWEYYDDEQKKFFIKMFDLARKEALNSAKNSPEFQLAKKIYEQQKWEEDFSSVVKEFPELANQKSEFKEFAYQPENIKTPLSILAKAFLFPIAEQRGAEQEVVKQKRTGLERATGGDKTNLQPKMTEEDWDRLARTNPSEFRKRGKEFEAWLAQTMKRG